MRGGFIATMLLSTVNLAIETGTTRCPTCCFCRVAAPPNNYSSAETAPFYVNEHFLQSENRVPRDVVWFS